MIPICLSGKVLAMTKTSLSKYLIASIICFFGISLGGSFAQVGKEYLFVGTYAKRDSKGIYVFEFDRSKGKLDLVQTILDKESPSYLDIHPKGEFLYAVNRQGTADKLDEGSISAFQINKKTGELDLIGTISSGGVGPCHVSVDPKGRSIYISHYVSSDMSVFALNKKGEIGQLVYSKKFEGRSANPERQKESHLHSIISSWDGKYIYASDLGTDLIHQFGISGSTKKLKVELLDSFHSKPGVGPRHLTIHPNGKYAFTVEELTSTVGLYSVDPKTGGLEFKDRADMIVASDKFTGSNTAADIQITPDGKFIYASNRGLDNIAIFNFNEITQKITYIGQEPSHGKHPRGMVMDKFGEYLFVANRDTDNIVALKIDRNTGMLTKTDIEINVPSPMVVRQLVIDDK